MSLKRNSMLTDVERQRLQEQLRRTAEQGEVKEGAVRVNTEDGEVFIPRTLSKTQWEYYTYVMEGYVAGIRRVFFFFGGATGVGKSVVTAHLVRDKALAYPGKTIIVGRYERTKLKDQFWPILLKHIPDELIAQKSHHAPLQITLFNGSRILGVGIKELETVIGMSDIAGIFLEEVHECEGDEIRMLTTRLREGVNEDMRQSISMTGNPHPGWVRDNMVINPIHVDGQPISHFHPAKIEDNPFIKQAQYRQMLRLGLTDEQYERMANGDWSVVGGLTYKHFAAQHVVDNDDAFPPLGSGEPLQQNATFGAGMDWGQEHPTVSLWGMRNEDGSYYIFDEWTGRYKHPTDSARIMMDRALDRWGLIPRGHPVPSAMSGKIRSSIKWIARPDVKRKNIVGEKSPYDLFRAAGLPLRIYPGIDRDARVQRLQWLFQRDLIKIHRRCKHLISNLQKNEWDTEKDSPKKEHDDAIDALMYLLDLLNMPEASEPTYDKDTPAHLIQAIKKPKSNVINFNLYGGADESIDFEALFG